MLLQRNIVVVLLFYAFTEVLSSNILGLFTSPHRSHMLVYQGIVRGLVKRGHNITIISVLPIDDEQILSTNVTVIKLKKTPKARPANGIFRQISVIAASGKLFSDPRFQEFLRHKDNTFDLVVLGYLFNDYQLGVGAHFKCPTVVVWTTQPISFVKIFIGEPNQWMIVPQPFVRSQVVGVRGLAYGVFETIFKRILDYIMNKIYRKYFPASNYPSLAHMQNNVSLVLCNHHFSEGPIEAHLPNLIEISGIQIRDGGMLPKELSEFMDLAEHGVIYFCLGSVVSARQLDQSTLKLFIDVFSSLSQKVIWKIDGFAKNSSNLMTSKWLPQCSLLAHPKLKLFITHGGKGSTIEAIYYGVPMIVIPFFGDQFANAHRLVNKGFGLKLETNNINEFLLRQYISEVLNNNTYYKNIREASKIFKDRPLSAEETATYWLDYVIRHRGAVHMQIPTKKINFIEYHNVNVIINECFSTSCSSYALSILSSQARLSNKTLNSLHTYYTYILAWFAAECMQNAS